MTNTDKKSDLKKELTLFLLILFVVTSCNNKTENKLLATDIRGTWYLNEWTTYHTLIFDNATILVDNNIDTVFKLNYTIDDNLLLTTTQYGHKTTVDTIVWLTSDSLVLTGIHNIKEKRSYTRIKKKWNE